jgi:hypothetical protein
VANLLKRYKWRYWQHPGMNLPPVSVQNDKGEQLRLRLKSCQPVQRSDSKLGFEF